MPRQWALASLPHHLNKEQVSQVLAVCQKTKPNELRNAAVLLLLARLGLRAGEVASLCLEDIHWAEGRLLIRAGKSHRERTLPLEEQVGHKRWSSICSIVGHALCTAMCFYSAMLRMDR